MMDNSLRYISISHKSVSLTERERYHISDLEKKYWIENIQKKFKNIYGLLILVTCNRTEVYFESDATNATQIRDFVIKDISGKVDAAAKNLFRLSDDTTDTVRQILEVSSGLASSVLGDAEIIHQIKVAYQESCKYKLQGSLLERCMQTIFRGHKRISNETGFRDGTTSVAYKTLKLIENRYNLPEDDSLKILLIGAGDIVKQLLNYNNKFGFRSVFVANRTAQRAVDLTQKYGGDLYDWDRVLDNDFEDFRVIVSAVSNRPDLVKQVKNRNRKTVVIDLAVPGNVAKSLTKQAHIDYYDLDMIAEVLRENHENRLKSIGQVESIISEELQDYSYWLEDAPIRKFLATYKSEVKKWLQNFVKQKDIQLQPEAIRVATNRIVRKSFKQDGKRIPEREMEGIVEQHI